MLQQANGFLHWQGDFCTRPVYTGSGRADREVMGLQSSIKQNERKTEKDASHVEAQVIGVENARSTGFRQDLNSWRARRIAKKRHGMTKNATGIDMTTEH